MNAQTRSDHAPATRAGGRAGALTALWALLLLEAILGVVVAILLSLVAGGYRTALAGEAGIAAEESTRFAAGGAFLFAIAAFVAAIGVRRRRAWSWNLGAILQLVLAIAAGIAMFAAGATGVTVAYLVAFGLAAVTMLLLSAPTVRRAVGQE